jgi:hypothetical protein
MKMVLIAVLAAPICFASIARADDDTGAAKVEKKQTKNKSKHTKKNADGSTTTTEKSDTKMEKETTSPPNP